MGRVGLSMGVHCPIWGPPYPTVLSEPLYVLFLSHSSPKYTVHYGSSLVSKSSVKKNVLPVSPGSTRLSTKSAMSKPPDSIVVKFDSMYPNCPQNWLRQKIDSMQNYQLHCGNNWLGLCHIFLLVIITFDSFIHYLLVLSCLSRSFNN